MRASRLTRRLFQWAFRVLSGHDHPTRIRADGPESLIRQFGLIDDGVPPRRERKQRHQDHKEWYCLRRYMMPLAERLEYPLTIYKSQSPDFLLEREDGSLTGLEIREATTEAFQKELTRTEGQRGPHPMTTDGWAGDEVEQGIAALVLEGVRDKVRKIRTPEKWTPAARHDLLFYSNGPYMAPDLSHLAEVLHAAAGSLSMLCDVDGDWPNGPLGTISVVVGNSLIYDVTGERSVLHFDAQWA